MEYIWKWTASAENKYGWHDMLNVTWDSITKGSNFLYKLKTQGRHLKGIIHDLFMGSSSSLPYLRGLFLLEAVSFVALLEAAVRGLDEESLGVVLVSVPGTYFGKICYSLLLFRD